MDNLFLAILNMSLTGAFVILAICLARLPLKKAPKVISYCLWGVAGFRLVFPFSIESVFSLIPFKAQMIPRDIAMQTIPRIDSGILVFNNAVSSVLPAATPQNSANPLQIWIAVCAFIWIVGVAAMTIYGVVSFLILKRNMKGSPHLNGNIYEAENIKSPFVLSIVNPKIYLPKNLAPQERSYIILHEQTHIRRHDHIVKFVAYFVLCLHWFNPFVWIAFVLMGVDMEMSCDERVLKEMGSDIKKDYSLSLLALATGRHFVSGSPLAFGEGGVKQRIKNVLNFKKHSRVMIAGAVALVAVLIVGFAMNRTSDEITAAPWRTYTLENPTDTEKLERLLSVSLYDDGTAQLATPLISSYLLPDCTYAFIDDALFIYANIEAEESEDSSGITNGDIIAQFEVADENTLVFKSANVPLFADDDARYVSADLTVNMADVYALSQLRTPYVGNNGAVGQIVAGLPRIDRLYSQQYFSISDDYGTGRAPHTLTVYYEPEDATMDEIKTSSVSPRNSVLLFALIDNLEEVSNSFRSTPGDGELDRGAYGSRLTYSRDDMGEYLETIGLTWADFHSDWNTSTQKLFTVSSPSMYEPQKWLDYLFDEQMPWEGSAELELPEYPDTVFQWTPYEVKAIGSNGEETLLSGMPVWSVYLADLTGDGLPELCAAVSIGSGIVDERIVVCDYAAGKTYELSDRFYYNYLLYLDGGRLMVKQSKNSDPQRDPLATGALAIVDGTLTAIGIDRTIPNS